MAEERCDLCDLPLAWCAHGQQQSRPAPVVAGPLEVSPREMAHLPGCSHKDDPDMSRWGRIEQDPAGAWQRLGNGGAVQCDAGSAPDLVARVRCRTCEAR